MKTYDGALMMLVTAWLLGFTTSAYAIVLDEPAECSDPITLTSPDGSSVTIQSSVPPLRQPNRSSPSAEPFQGSVGMRIPTIVPLEHPIDANLLSPERFALTPSQKERISLVPHTSLRKPNSATKGQVTFQPIPTHWDAKFIPIPTHWHAEIILVAPLAGTKSSETSALTPYSLSANDKKD